MMADFLFEIFISYKFCCRSRLVSAQVSVEEPGISEESLNDRDVIPLLCSIFLANQGSGESAGDESPLLCVSATNVYLICFAV